MINRDKTCELLADSVFTGGWSLMRAAKFHALILEGMKEAFDQGVASSGEAEQQSLRSARICTLAGQLAAKKMCPNLEGDFSAILMHLDAALSRSHSDE